MASAVYYLPPELSGPNNMLLIIVCWKFVGIVGIRWTCCTNVRYLIMLFVFMHFASGRSAPELVRYEFVSVSALL